MAKGISKIINNSIEKLTPFRVGLISWVLVSVLYLPAARAGFVADFTGWLDQMQRYGFWDNINRTHYHVKSFYQFTQFNTYVYYLLFGTNAIAWHLLFVTLQAINCGLLYKVCHGLLSHVQAQHAKLTAFFGVVFFCVGPSLSEVVVWEPSFHYLQGMLLLLLVLHWAQEFLLSGYGKYVVFAAIVYLLSTFSLEIFYITPWLALSMALFYNYSGASRNTYFGRAVRAFFGLLLGVFVLHLLLYRVVYGVWVAHIGTQAATDSLLNGFGKPAKHLFNVLLLGRFLPNGLRQWVYNFFDSTSGLVLFYSLMIAAAVFIILRFRKLGAGGKVAGLIFFWMGISLALLIPLWFTNLQLIIYDRYTYFAGAFAWMLLAVLLGQIPYKYVHCTLVAIIIGVNVRFTVMVSRYWMKSERVIRSLLSTIPTHNTKTVILLNLPQNMHGASMIGAEEESEFKMMHDGLYPADKIQAPVYDAMAYNMETPEDGAHVTVLNDSTLKVTLAQWGTWWWYGMQGGHGYQNADYTLKLTDPGHEYLLTVKHPAANYLLLYQIGASWKTVDMAKMGQEQQ